MDDPELRIVIAACRASYGGQPPVAVRGRINWDRVLELAQRHRVQALCWLGLTDVHEQVQTEVAWEFATLSQAIVEQNLRAATECARLLGSFQRAGVDLIFLKGLTLAALAYSNPMLKMGWDIDLLVAPHQIEDAADLLRDAGYDLQIPGSRENLDRWHERRKESVWRNPTSAITIDLHSRLADHPALLPTVGIGSPVQLVTVAKGIELPTLAKDELFAYLCVHGASSAWFRLKWLCDLAALLHREPAYEVDRLYTRSQQLGAGRAADQALLLVCRLFGLGLSEELKSRLQRNRISRWLTDLARDQLSNPREPTERFLGTAAIHYSQPFLLPGLNFKLSELARQARDIARAE